IYPINTSGEAGTRLILPNQIEAVFSNGTPVNNYILSIITHGTNGFKKKKHISPVLTRAKRLADDNKSFRERIRLAQNNSESEELLNEALKELDEMKVSHDEKELFYLEQVELAENSLREELKRNVFLESEVDRLKFEKESLSSNA
ncbi:TPA: hypothetical protein ACNZ87_005634, partial [Klebsiella pneumoniae]